MVTALILHATEVCYYGLRCSRCYGNNVRDLIGEHFLFTLMNFHMVCEMLLIVIVAFLYIIYRFKQSLYVKV